MRHYINGNLVGGFVPQGFTLYDVTLSFGSGLTYTLTDSRITADTRASVWYDDGSKSAASVAGVTGETVSGGIVFTALTVPSADLKCTIDCRY